MAQSIITQVNRDDENVESLEEFTPHEGKNNRI